MSETYDGLILGAGHNGLILQAYLGKAGLKTLAIERRPVAGGGLSTLEDPRHPGFLHNTHAFFQRAITAMPWYADLDLERHGTVDADRIDLEGLVDTTDELGRRAADREVLRDLGTRSLSGASSAHAFSSPATSHTTKRAACRRSSSSSRGSRCPSSAWDVIRA